jgi:hypothetical protein
MTLATVALVLAATGVRLLWLHAPVERDEAGYLLVAGQWRAGTSVYGNYWVDRPPLLLAFFQLADALGGLVALRLLGCALAGLTVWLASRLGAALGEDSGAPVWPALAAAGFVSTPWFGVQTVNGELVAVPLVLGGLVAVVRAARAGGRARTAWWLVAGALAAGAGLVKQNFLDVFVFAAALALASALQRPAGSPRVRLGDLALMAAGAVLATSAVLGYAAWHGTGMRSLYDAIVVSRLHAVGLLTQIAGRSTVSRVEHYPVVLLLSGAALILAALAARALSARRSRWVFAAVALLAWELFSIVASGQFWGHYLIQLVPGLALVTALATAAGDRIATFTKAAAGYAVLAAALATATTLAAVLAPTANQASGQWLRAAARHGDTAVVLFGQPNVLYGAGLQSPYSQLWALPILVEDPLLTALTHVLRGPHPPTWVLVDGRQRKSHQRAAVIRRLLRPDYVGRTTVCRYRVYLHTGISRRLPPRPTTC